MVLDCPGSRTGRSTLSDVYVSGLILPSTMTSVPALRVAAIPFNRYFCVSKPLRVLDEIDEDLKMSPPVS